MGEMLCLGSRLDYLRDAMPFDKIFVSLSCKVLYECGAVLSLPILSHTTLTGRREKLAVGKQKVVWVNRHSGGQITAASLPEKDKRCPLVESTQRLLPFYCIVNWRS